MKAVFLDSKTFHPDIRLTNIEQACSELVCYQTTSKVQIIERCLDAEVVISNKVLLSGSVLCQLPKLKLICIAATGTNNVDVVAAKKYNITVTNVRSYATRSLSQYVFAQILDHYVNPQHHQMDTEKGLWPKSDTFCVLGNPITELANKTIGIIGYGSLAKAVEKLALAFEMNVIIAERLNSEVTREGRMPFDKVLQQADIVSLHCPQTPETEGIMNKSAFEKMKPTAMLINTARGALIDNEALLWALTNNQLGYAVLDVLEKEPPPANHILLQALSSKDKLNNLKITAHIAWASQEAQQTLINYLADNILNFKQGKLKNRVDC